VTCAAVSDGVAFTRNRSSLMTSQPLDRIETPLGLEQQRSIFGSDALVHFDTPLVAVENPCPGITFAIASPFPLASSVHVSRHNARWVRVMAVADTGDMVVARIRFDGDIDGFWKSVAARFARDDVGGEGAWALPDQHHSDTMDALLDPGLWGLSPLAPPPVVQAWARGHARLRYEIEGIDETTGYAFVVEQALRLKALVLEALQRVDCDVRQVMLERRSLSYRVGRRLLQFSRSCGEVDGLRNVRQALRTEPLPTLRWLAELHSGRPLRDALLRGRSVPAAICESASLAPATQRFVARHAQHVPDASVTHWLHTLAVLQFLPRQFWPADKSDWRELMDVVAAVGSESDFTGPPEKAGVLVLEILRSHHRLRAAPSGAREENSARASYGKMHADRCLANAIMAIYRQVTGQACRVSPSVVAACWATAKSELPSNRLERALGTSAPAFVHHWLATLPEISPLRVDGYVFSVLRTQEEVFRLGRSLRNCLRRLRHQMSYLLSGHVLFSIQDAEGNAVGVAAYYLEQVAGGVWIQFHESLGEANADLPPAVAEAANHCRSVLCSNSKQFADYRRIADVLARAIEARLADE